MQTGNFDSEKQRIIRDIRVSGCENGHIVHLKETYICQYRILCRVLKAFLCAISCTMFRCIPFQVSLRYAFLIEAELRKKNYRPYFSLEIHLVY